MISTYFLINVWVSCVVRIIHNIVSIIQNLRYDTSKKPFSTNQQFIDKPFDKCIFPRLDPKPKTIFLVDDFSFIRIYPSHCFSSEILANVSEYCSCGRQNPVASIMTAKVYWMIKYARWKGSFVCVALWLSQILWD